MAGLRFLAGGVVQYTNNAGAVLAAGTINTYITGTTTDKTTFSNSARTVANPNPIVLDSSGKAVIYLALNGEYRFLIKDSAGVTVDTVDNISGQVRTHQGVLLTGGSVTPGSGTETAVPITSEAYDTEGYHNPAANQSRITIPIGSGITRVSFGARAVFAANSTGYRGLGFKKNAGSLIYRQTVNAITTASTATQLVSVTPTLIVAEGDFFECSVFQNSGGGLLIDPVDFWMDVFE